MNSSEMNDRSAAASKIYDDIELSQLRQAVDDIIDSGELGRSKIYTKLLKYLADASVGGRLPKELEIAIDVLGRDDTFDVSKDSAVRVSVHQLRKRLESYYAKGDLGKSPRLVIPKGQYNLELESPSIKPDSATLKHQHAVTKSETQKYNGISRILLVITAFLLVLNLSYWILRDYRATGIVNNSDVISHPFWKIILSDDIPIMVVLGDYYIFGEQDDAGNIRRMVREFDINSSDDLESLFTEQPELAWRYRDLDLSYIPEGAALALSSILPIVHSSEKSVTVKMMSELSTQDLQTHHVLYLGYVSGLNRLSRIVFAASGLKVGDNYDELINENTGQRFVSDAGLPSENRPFIGYGFVSSIPTTENNRLVVVSGMRDSGLSQMAKSLGDNSTLSQINTSLFEGSNKKIAFELLYEVRGMDRKNFSSRPVYEHKINSNLIWQIKD
ncbi:MAG: hypothetical protein ACRBCS_15760 [Cellvibrionaceae bacterium]